MRKLIHIFPPFPVLWYIKLSAVILLWAMWGQTQAQYFPVQATTQLVPPYSVYLSDYATAGNEKLRVILLQRDLTQPSYQLRLVMQVEWNGKVIMQTSRAFNPAPISLDPGVPTIISGAELAPYLDSRNIDFVGYSREQYERTRALPEGSYRIIFTAYDYRRQDVQVSNEGSGFYYLTKNEPPLINMPVCGAKVPVRSPQQVIFSWLPRNIASPNSVMETRYEFSLYEIRPEGRNPNDVVLSSRPIYRTTTDFAQLVYGPAEPLLQEGMSYAWQVRAIDTGGRDAFRNNGYSEVCTFSYSATDPAFNIGAVEGLQAEGKSERRARIWWEKGGFDSYRIYYKKTGEGHEWFHSDLQAEDLDRTSDEGELKLYGLEPDTGYEARAQGRKRGMPGPYTEIIKFRTMPVRPAYCGDPALLPEGGTGDPYLEAIKGDIVNVDGMEMTLLDVVHLGDGRYKGLGRVSVDYLGGAAFNVAFDRIFINQDREVVLGRIDFVTKGVAAMVGEQLAAQEEREEERNENDLANNDNAHEQKDIIFEGVIDSLFVDGTGGIVIIDTEGERVVYEQPIDPVTGGKLPINIVDSGGNGYAVDSEGKVTGNSGSGGNEPDENTGPRDLSLQEKLVVEVLTGFEQELETWLSTYGKGPLSKEEIVAFLALPDYVPEDPEMVEGILNYVQEVKENPQGFTRRLFDEEGETLGSLLEDADQGQPLKDQLDETKWQQAEQTIIEEAVDQGLLDWFTGLPYRERAAKVLKEHPEGQGMYDEVWVPELNRAKVLARLNLSEGASLEQEIDLSTVEEDKIFDLLVLTYEVPYWEANALNVEGWEKVVNWLRTQDDKIARQQGWAVGYANFVADVVNAPAGTILGWLTGKHWRTGQELVWWEQVLGILDVVPGEALAKAGITALVVRIWGKAFDLAKVTAATRSFIMAAKSAGLKLVARTTDEVILYGTQGTQQIGRFTNGILQDIYWVYGGEKALAKLAGVRYIVDNKTVQGALEVVEDGAKVGIKFPSLIRQLVTKPSYLPGRTIWSKSNKTTTLIGRWQDDLEKVMKELKGADGISTSDLNIYMISGKFDNPGGFNMLSIENWSKVADDLDAQGIKDGMKAFDDYIWEQYNKPWLENAMQRGDDIVIWSDPLLPDNLIKPFRIEKATGSTFFSRELNFIKENASRYGYDFEKGILNGTFLK